MKDMAPILKFAVLVITIVAAIYGAINIFATKTGLQDTQALLLKQLNESNQRLVAQLKESKCRARIIRDWLTNRIVILESEPRILAKNKAADELAIEKGKKQKPLSKGREQVLKQLTKEIEELEQTKDAAKAQQEKLENWLLQDDLFVNGKCRGGS